MIDKKMLLAFIDSEKEVDLIRACKEFKKESRCSVLGALTDLEDAGIIKSEMKSTPYSEKNVQRYARFYSRNNEVSEADSYILEWCDQAKESDYSGKEFITGVGRLHRRMDELLEAYGSVKFIVNCV